MDPIANLARQRELSAQIIARHNGFEDWHPQNAADGAELAELVIALDDWRRSGGFDPYKPTTIGA